MTVTDAVSILVFFKQKTAYEIRPRDWSSDVCSSDLEIEGRPLRSRDQAPRVRSGDCSLDHLSLVGQEARDGLTARAYGDEGSAAKVVSSARRSYTSDGAGEETRSLG